MTTNEIIAMATEAGLNSYRIAPGEAVAAWERFAALVAAREREACAQAAPAAQGDALDAARYRWLRGEQQRIASVIDKEYSPGYWEYRSGDELDSAIDAARKQGANHD